MRPYFPSFIAALSVVLAAGVGLGCTTIHEGPDTGDKWEVPSRFDRDSDSEDEELIFALRDERNDVSAIVQRTTPPFPDILIPYFVAQRVDRLDDDPEALVRSESPKGWVGGWNDGDTGRWIQSYAFTGEKATYILLVEGPAELANGDGELFDELVNGFSPADTPRTDDQIDEVPLQNGLGANQPVELKPLDVDENPRRALRRDLDFSTRLTTGHILREPLTFAVDPQTYLELIATRLQAQDSSIIDFDKCGDDCAVMEWTSADEPDYIHLAGAATVDEKAYQIRLRAPAVARELEPIHHQWLSEFLLAPEHFFADEDTP